MSFAANLNRFHVSGERVLNEEQGCILRVLLGEDRPMRASEVFARVNVLVPHPVRQFDALAREARKLDRLGLLVHRRDALGCVALQITSRGRRVSGEAKARKFVGAVAGVAAVAPALMSCATVGAPEPRGYAAQPLRAVGATQKVVGGIPVWAICDSTSCGTPTPKHPAAPATQGFSAFPKRETNQAPAPSIQSSGQTGPAAAIVSSVSTQSQAAPKPLAAASQAAAPVAATRRVDAAQAVQDGELSFAAYSVYFALGSADIAGVDEKLVSAAGTLALNASSRVTVVGLTDPSGSVSVNKALARLRAERVRDRLAASGVDPERVNTLSDISATQPPPSFGVRRPGITGSAAYRRADIVIRWPKGSGGSVGESSQGTATQRASS